MGGSICFPRGHAAACLTVGSQQWSQTSEEWRTASPEIIITWNRHTSFGQKRLTCFNRKQRRGEGGSVFFLGKNQRGFCWGEDFWVMT